MKIFHVHPFDVTIEREMRVWGGGGGGGGGVHIG